MIVPPNGPRDAHVAICGESPGKAELEAGMGFVGPSGKILWNPGGDNDLLGLHGYPRESVYVTNITKFACNDVEWKALNLDVRDKHVADVRAELSALPSLRVVIAVGVRACQALAPNFATMTEDHGKARVGYGRYIVLPVFHPAAYLRGNREVLSYLLEDLGQLDALVAGADEALKVADEVAEVIAWPPTIAFLAKDAKPAPKTSRCKYCGKGVDKVELARYAGKSLKWVLCMEHAIRTAEWAKVHGDAIEAERANEVAHSDAMRRMDVAHKMQEALSE